MATRPFPFLRRLLTILALLGLTGAPAAGAAEETKASAAADGPEAVEFPQPVTAERNAAGIVRNLGGWYELDTEGHVTEVNMVYREDSAGRRQDNHQKTDEVLAHLGGFPQLKRLRLQGTQASDEGLAFVGRLPQLEELSIWDARTITDEGVAHLQGLARLKDLHLSNSRITDEAILHLSKIASIESLVMQDNVFTDEALQYAARMPRLKKLILNSKARFTDEGMQHIRDMPMLEELCLLRTGISEEGIKSLHGLKTLKLVWIDKFNKTYVPGVREAAVRELQQATPDLSVRLGGMLLPSVNILRAAADPGARKVR